MQLMSEHLIGWKVARSTPSAKTMVHTHAHKASMTELTQIEINIKPYVTKLPQVLFIR